MSSLESAIQWYQDKMAQKVTYSMVNRYGPNSYDCSSALYYALIAGGFFPIGIHIGNTDSLYGDLEKYGWVRVAPDSNDNVTTQRGDVGLWGVRGQSAGGSGHAMDFVSAPNIIHCSSGYNGIHIDNHDWLNSINSYPPLTVYRFAGHAPSFANNPDDQVIEVGSVIRFDKAYHVDDLQLAGEEWQIKTDELCHSDFTWDDNGIPSSIVAEVDAIGNATPDQELAVGSVYVIPGKFTVLDVGQDGNRWLGQIEANGLKFWVDLETTTEIKASDDGHPNPPQPPVPSAPVVIPPVSPPTTPVDPPVTSPVIAPPAVPETPVIVTPQPVKKVSIWQLILEFLLGFFGVKL